MVIGDMNFHYFGQQGSQKQLKQIRDQVHENIIAEGWSQLINQNTRYQKNCTPSCLDHIYSRSTADVEYVKNFNETGYDHNCVGVYINVSKRILHPQVQEYRDVTGIALGDFNDMFNDLDLAGIHTAQDVDEAAELLTHNINLVLNKYAPVKKRILRFKTSAHWLIIVRNNMIKNMINDDDADWEAFRRFRNQLKSDLKKENGSGDKYQETTLTQKLDGEPLCLQCRVTEMKIISL